MCASFLDTIAIQFLYWRYNKWRERRSASPTCPAKKFPTAKARPCELPLPTHAKVSASSTSPTLRQKSSAAAQSPAVAAGRKRRKDNRKVRRRSEQEGRA